MQENIMKVHSVPRERVLLTTLHTSRLGVSGPQPGGDPLTSGTRGLGLAAEAPRFLWRPRGLPPAAAGGPPYVRACFELSLENSDENHPKGRLSHCLVSCETWRKHWVQNTT